MRWTVHKKKIVCILAAVILFVTGIGISEKAPDLFFTPGNASNHVFVNNILSSFSQSIPKNAEEISGVGTALSELDAGEGCAEYHLTWLEQVSYFQAILPEHSQYYMTSRRELAKDSTSSKSAIIRYLKRQDGKKG